MRKEPKITIITHRPDITEEENQRRWEDVKVTLRKIAYEMVAQGQA